MPKFVPETTTKVGEKGIAMVHGVVSEMGHTWNSTKVDAGTDGHIEIIDPTTHEATNCLLGVQVKTKTEGEPLQSESDTEFSYTCSRDDIEYWRKGSLPTLLVICRPPNEMYWVSVNKYFADHPGTQTVRYDKARDRLTKSTGPELHRLAIAKSPTVYSQPTPKNEVLTSNLLEITRLPAHVFLADAKVETSKDIYESFANRGITGHGGFCIRGKKLYSVHDLADPIWKNLCDPKTIKKLTFSEWASDEADGRPREVIELLNKCISGLLFERANIRFNQHEDFYHFMKPKERDEQKLPHAGKTREFLKASITPYYTPDGKIKYYSHVAFKGTILQFGGRYFLEISPTYHYTRDGVTPVTVAEALRSGIKRMERNLAVKQTLTLISESIQRGQQADILRPEYPHLQFGALLSFNVNQGIDDALWNKAKAKPATKIEKATVEGLF